MKTSQIQIQIQTLMINTTLLTYNRCHQNLRRCYLVRLNILLSKVNKKLWRQTKLNFLLSNTMNEYKFKLFIVQDSYKPNHLLAYFPSIKLKSVGSFICMCPFELLNQVNELHKTRYKHYATTSSEV